MSISVGWSIQLLRRIPLLHRASLEFMDDFPSLYPNSDSVKASRIFYPAIAMHCDSSISMSSMSCYDAAAMEVPSLMLCPTVQNSGIHQERFIDLQTEGFATKTEFTNKR
jgi:hypothetical protein